MERVIIKFVRQRALIVDDEADGRRELLRLLAAHSDRIGVVGEAVDGPSAVDAIQKLHPDVVFLDMEMPGLDGFGVLDSLPEQEWPIVIFTSANNRYAIRAFEIHALDYMLKPVTPKRLSECLSRLDAIRPGAQRNRLERARRDNRTIERLMARAGSKLLAVNLKDVIAFESQDELAFARTSQGRFALNVTIKELEERLDPHVFCRVHKQSIAQLSLAREIRAGASGLYVLKLADGSELEIGRSYAREFRSRFAQLH
jgi:two-component system, LytTR family, response regulator